jgi:hypothetical protein
MKAEQFLASLNKFAAMGSGSGAETLPHTILQTLVEREDEHDREEWLTWVLRPHRDPPSASAEQSAGYAGNAYADVADLRRALDDALDALTCVEIELQCGKHDGELAFALPQEVRGPLCILAKSEAFLRYLDSYLFFGVRFLMGRDAEVRKAWEAARTVSAELPDQFNRPILPLETPPALGLNLKDDAEQVRAVLKLLSESPPASEQQALYFLDGFHQKLGSKTAAVEQKVEQKASEVQAQSAAAAQEPVLQSNLAASLESDAAPSAEFVADKAAHQADTSLLSSVHDLELWLRGVMPEPRASQESLPEIANGMRLWAIRHAKLYDTLSESRAYQDGTVAGAEKLWHTRRSDTPRVMRVALLDLYWLAGVLRADVTPAGEVTYADASWLNLLAFRDTIGLPDDGTLPAISAADSAEWPLDRVEEVLRSAFSSACELVQNAAERAEARNCQQAGGEPVRQNENERLTGWRGVLDAELGEILRQRNLRRFQPLNEKTEVTSGGVSAGGDQFLSADDKSHPGWSRRLFACGHPRDLVGIALSGGGIRSATFNLGVLQGLQELDLLRQVDFLSTVSGGGFIGSWLLANVKRTRYWLSRETPWDHSVALLRAYSNYLAPRTGFFSMDMWSLGTLWLRNTLLIQLSTLAGMLTLFTVPYLFRWGAARVVNQLDSPMYGGLASGGKAIVLLGGVTALLVAIIILLNLLWPYRPFVSWRARRASSKGWQLDAWQRSVAARYILWLAAIPAWIGAAFASARLFGIQSRMFPKFTGQVISGIHHPVTLMKVIFFPRLVASAAGPSGLSTHYSTILSVWPTLWWPALLASFAAFLVLMLTSVFVANNQMSPSADPKRNLHGSLNAIPVAICAAALCTVVLHLCFSAMLFGYLHLNAAYPHAPAGVHNVAFLAGPALVLVSYSAALLLLIGLSGKYWTESQREWWTRFGSYILAVALVGLLLCGVAFGSPWLIERLFAKGYYKHAIPTALLGWLGTTIGGLLAGKSNKTSGEPTSKSISLELIAKLGGLIFLIGAAVGAAELLYLFFHAWITDETNLYPHVSQSISKFGWKLPLGTFAVLGLLTTLFSRFFEINIFGLNQLYRNRLVRAYLGATRWMPGMRSPEPFTQFDFNDDIYLNKFVTTDAGAPFRGPFPIINCTLNLSGSSDVALHTRHSASFSLTPLFCGADRARVGYTGTDRYAGSVRLGQAVAVSGAAASPNMGYNTSPLVAFLLTMFNVRLGWWFPNPSKARANELRLGWSLPYLIRELAGLADETQNDLNISDGGHFENLGIYELVRRNCTVIIAGDAECDEQMAFGGLANVIRLCETDFGAIIDIDASPLSLQADGLSRTHAAVGTIKYSNGSIGHLIYLKSSITGDEDPTITQYRAAHPTFPHESTAEQFFSEDQFESYRRLGLHVVRTGFRSAAPGEHLVHVTQKMADRAAPPQVATERFLRHTQQLGAIWNRLRKQAQTVQPGGVSFLSELLGTAKGSPPALTDDVTAIGLELLQLMEDVFVDLSLDDAWGKPDNRGWAILFLDFARSPRLRTVWQTTHRAFDIRFEYFCANRLGLERDHPVVRV